MEIIEIHHPYAPDEIPSDHVVLALGFFDGVHRAHQKVINRGREEANKRGLKLAAMTFNHHPSIVFQKINPHEMRYLTTLEQKIEHMEALGVDYLYVVEFTSHFASLKPQAFVDQYMVGLNAEVVVAGFDYTYGPKDLATMAALPEYCQDRFEIIAVEKQMESELKIGSTEIRQFMALGDMENAARYLGYVYELSGIVVHGDKRGRLLGFPTANIKVSYMSRLPRKGVYAVKIRVADKWFLGMAQIGYNISFEQDRDLTIEVNILDFDQDIYGEQVDVQWYSYLSDEIKFDGIDGLIAQLEQDRADTREYFNHYQEPAYLTSPMARRGMTI